MSNPTIAKDGVTFTFQDGDISSVDIKKNAQLDTNPLPGQNTDQAFVLDFNGSLKTITVSGRITDALTTRTSSGTTTTIEQQIAWLEELVDGGQTGYTFNSTFQTNKTVFVNSVTFGEIAGEANLVEFNMEMVEGL